MKTLLSISLVILSFLPFALSAQLKAASQGTETVADPVKVREIIADLLQEKIDVLDKKTQVSDSPTDIKVLDNRIEFKIKDQNATLLFVDLINDPIPAVYFKKNKSILSLINFDFISGGFNNSYKRLVQLRDNLILIQKDFKAKKEEADMVAFMQKIKEYRAMTVKPPLTEELRKYIVQANLFSQQKNYVKAIELYRKVIDTDAIAYPAGYSNIALLSAQVGNYGAAITYMKWYLMLEPEASDARGAQDKIYEWEAMLAK